MNLVLIIQKVVGGNELTNICNGSIPVIVYNCSVF